MKRSFCFDTVSGTGQKWFWDEVAEMTGACGYDSVEIPFSAWTFNAGRSGAPLCAVAIRTKFGNVKNYEDFLENSKIPGGISSIYINADNVLSTMFEYNTEPQHIFEKIVELGKETVDVLAEAGGKAVIIDPSPKIATMRRVYGKMTEEERVAWYFDGAAKAVNEIADYAEGFGVKTYVRNCFFGYMRGSEVEKFMALVNDKVGFSPDLNQLYIAGADAAALIEKFAGRVDYMKCNDSFYKDELHYFDTNTPEAPAEGNHQRVYCDLGNGDVDVPGAYKAFKKAGGETLCLSSKASFNFIKAMIKMQVYANKYLND